jgi:hypothetical protein
MTWGMMLVTFIATHGVKWWMIAMPFALVAWWAFDIFIVWKQEINAALQYSQEFIDLKREIAVLRIYIEAMQQSLKNR